MNGKYKNHNICRKEKTMSGILFGVLVVVLFAVQLGRVLAIRRNMCG